MRINLQKYSPVMVKYNTQVGISNSGKSNLDNLENKTLLPSFAQSAILSSNIFKNTSASFSTRPGRVTLDEYRAVKKRNPLIIEKAYDYLQPIEKDHDLMPNITAKSAYLVKTYLDKHFGKEKYRIISIGTSPAPLVYPMNILGCDAVFLPLSGVKNYNKNTCSKNAKLAMDYLQTKNIDDGKLNIILDYSSSGESLKIAKELCAERFPKTPFITKETQSLLCNVLSKAADRGLISPIEEDEMIQAFGMDQLRSNCEMLCNVPHFYVNNYRNKNNPNAIDSDSKTKKEVFALFEAYSSKYARAFELCTIAELDSMGLI